MTATDIVPFPAVTISFCLPVAAARSSAMQDTNLKEASAGSTLSATRTRGSLLTTANPGVSPFQNASVSISYLSTPPPHSSKYSIIQGTVSGQELNESSRKKPCPSVITERDISAFQRTAEMGATMEALAWLRTSVSVALGTRVRNAR